MARLSEIEQGLYRRIPNGILVSSPNEDGEIAVLLDLTLEGKSGSLGILFESKKQALEYFQAVVRKVKAAS